MSEPRRLSPVELETKWFREEAGRPDFDRVLSDWRSAGLEYRRVEDRQAARAARVVDGDRAARARDRFVQQYDPLGCDRLEPARV